MALSKVWNPFGKRISLVDVLLFLLLALAIYSMVGVAALWTGPYRPKTDIDLGVGSLVQYSFLSLIRVTAAYFLSLVFTLTYGYMAAKSRVGEVVLIPILDILQSVPVLGFMPGLVLALVHLFPHSNVGLELAAVLMIFTGEGWNMVFSFYSSVKGVPQELKDLSNLFRMRRWDVLWNIEIPYATNGLLWNSMLSMAGGWFFLMTIESFTLGDRDFRLPGIGSYMAVAYERNDLSAILCGIGAMFTLIILVDRCVWAPLVAWSERFKLERDPHSEVPRSVVLEWIKRSRLLKSYLEIIGMTAHDLRKRRQSAQKQVIAMLPHPTKRQSRWLQYTTRATLLLMVLFFTYFSLSSTERLISQIPFHGWVGFIGLTALTFTRVVVAVILGSLWTIPLGVFIGMNQKWTRRLQPVVQVVASFPAPMLFPAITALLFFCGISLEIGSVLLLLFASQWYILFNVISGARLIPQYMVDLGAIFGLKGKEYWKRIILPAIFPSLVNGWITAAGGAWNATIVSEIVFRDGKAFAATGIGSAITQAAQSSDFPRLAGTILVMVTTVVLLNRFFWGNLYRLAETRYRME